MNHRVILINVLYLILFTIYSNFSFSITINQKLHKQWEHYKKAQQLLLLKNSNSSVPIEKRVVSRLDWEKTIQVDLKYKITENDLDQLRHRQQLKARQSKQKAIKRSIINFDNFRKLNSIHFNQKVKQFCSELPKGGLLHVHPWGTFDSRTINNILNKYNPKSSLIIPLKKFNDINSSSYFYPWETSWIKQLPVDKSYSNLSELEKSKFISLNFLPDGSHPFERFQASFKSIKLLIDNEEKLYSALLDFGKRAQENKVRYVEFTHLVTNKNLPTFLSLAKIYKEKYGIILNINHSFFRKYNPTQLRFQTEDFIDNLNSPIIVGIDFAGNERSAPTLESGQTVYATILNAMKQNKRNLHLTMHAGELGNNKNPRDAMIMGVERIGHGVNLINDPIAIEYAIKNKIAIEINLVSNLKLQAVKKLKNHPYLHFLRLGIPVSLSTDDEGIFKTDISNECVQAIKYTDVTYYEMKEMAFNSIKYSFSSPKVKEQLEQALKDDFNHFEKKYNYKK